MSDVKNRTEVEQRKPAENSASTMETLCRAAYAGLLGATMFVPGMLTGSAVKAAQAGAEIGNAVRESGEEALIIGALFSPAGAVVHKAAQLGMEEAKRFMDEQKKKK